jgi:hypothetical protein
MKTLLDVTGGLAVLFLAVDLASCQERRAEAAPREVQASIPTLASPPAIDPKASYEPREGDIIFQSLPHNALVDAIEGSTDSPFSHCGILRQSGEDWLVIESIGTVTETPLKSWIDRGRSEHYAVYRLKETYQGKIPLFIKEAQGYKGLPYDIHYEMDDKAIYCSELIYKAFQKAAGENMGTLQKLGELKWQPHVAVIKQIEGGNVPLERAMITPRGLTESSQVVKVFSNLP